MSDDLPRDERRTSQCPACKASRGMPFPVIDGAVRKVTYDCPLCGHTWDVAMPPESDETDLKP